jgi:hypothetical protein
MSKGGGDFWIIVGIIIYFTLIGWLCTAMGYGVTEMMHTGNWQVPYTSYSISALTYFVDFFAFIVNVMLWFFQSIASYLTLFYFTVRGDIPAFVSAIGITPVALGFGWMVLRLVRG